MPINRESVPPPTIGKIGPYTVFVTPPSTPKPPLDSCPEVVLPPVLPPPQQFHKSAASDADRTFLGFFKNALDKVHNAHSSLDDHMARWLGLNQSKYQWALDDYYESKGLEKEGLKAKECSNKQQQEYNYVLSAVWSVRAALGVREGTKGTWSRCNSSLTYTNTVSSSVPYHKNLGSSSNLRALMYRAWFVNGQVAGYTQEFINGDYTLEGPVAPEYKPKECY